MQIGFDELFARVETIVWMSSLGRILQCPLQLQVLDEPMQVIRVQPQEARRGIVIAVRFFDRSHDQILLRLLDRVMEVRRRRTSAGRRRCTGLGHGIGQIVPSDDRVQAEDNGMLDGVLELTHIPRPLVHRQTGKRIG